MQKEARRRSKTKNGKLQNLSRKKIGGEKNSGARG
jgi:hypothetical protein